MKKLMLITIIMFLPIGAFGQFSKVDSIREQQLKDSALLYCADIDTPYIDYYSVHVQNLVKKQKYNIVINYCTAEINDNTERNQRNDQKPYIYYWRGKAYYYAGDIKTAFANFYAACLLSSSNPFLYISIVREFPGFKEYADKRYTKEINALKKGGNKS